jgi:hypothetical protein
MEVSGWFHAPVALPLRKEPRYPLERSLCGLQSQCGHCDAHQNPALSRIEVVDFNTIYEGNSESKGNIKIFSLYDWQYC